MVSLVPVLGQFRSEVRGDHQSFVALWSWGDDLIAKALGSSGVLPGWLHGVSQVCCVRRCH